jgi:hypothetical protein
MARHLTEADVLTVVRLIEDWHYDLTWAALEKACMQALGFAPSRQTFHRHSSISIAFTEKKKSLKISQESAKVPVPISMRIAVDKIERLEQKLREAENANDMILEQFVRWQYNASLRGISRECLNAALPVVDLSPTEKRKR